MIKLSQVYSKTNVMIAFQHQYIPENLLQITEIVYKCHDHWQIHNAKFSYQHPSEYMPTYQRKLIKNHFILGFVPFGGNFNEFILPFISEMKKLEQGKIMMVQGQN